MTNVEFKEKREKTGLSQAAFGIRIGLSKDQVAARENGRSKITPEEESKILALNTESIETANETSTGNVENQNENTENQNEKIENTDATPAENNVAEPKKRGRKRTKPIENKPIHMVQQIIENAAALTTTGKLRVIENDGRLDIFTGKKITVNAVYKALYENQDKEEVLEKIYLAYPDHTKVATRYAKTEIKRIMTQIIRKHDSSYAPAFAGKKLERELQMA